MMSLECLRILILFSAAVAQLTSGLKCRIGLKEDTGKDKEIKCNEKDGSGMWPGICMVRYRNDGTAHFGCDNNRPGSPPCFRGSFRCRRTGDLLDDDSHEYSLLCCCDDKNFCNDRPFPPMCWMGRGHQKKKRICVDPSYRSSDILMKQGTCTTLHMDDGSAHYGCNHDGKNAWEGKHLFQCQNDQSNQCIEHANNVDLKKINDKIESFKEKYWHIYGYRWKSLGFGMDLPNKGARAQKLCCCSGKRLCSAEEETEEEWREEEEEEKGRRTRRNEISIVHTTTTTKEAKGPATTRGKGNVVSPQMIAGENGVDGNNGKSSTTTKEKAVATTTGKGSYVSPQMKIHAPVLAALIVINQVFF